MGIACLPSTGATAPITIAGTVLLSGVEILAMLVMSQLMQPGTPVIGFPIFFTLDMATGRNLQSSVESILGAAATVQFVKEAFHIPTHTYGFGTDAHTEDGQAALESALRGVLVSQAGCDILGGAGQLDVATAIGPVQLIIDCILVSVLKRMRAGVKVDDDTLAWEDIMDTVPIGHFLERPHTLKHCREALRPQLLASQPMPIWSSQGSKDLYTRAVERYEELKKKLQPQPLPEDVQRELDRIVKQADEHLVK
jgi:trimethylamine--corrinoid protein Co-methyltransferase